jgi:hypothetical protein
LNSELKIIYLFDSSSFVYFKKPCSTGFWEILFISQNPEPKKSRTEKIMTGKRAKRVTTMCSSFLGNTIAAIDQEYRAKQN